MASETALAERTEYVEADMNYIVDDGIPPVMYVDWPEEEHKAHQPTYVPHRTRIENGRPVADSFNLDTHGFAFVENPSAVKDYYDDAEVEEVAYPEVAALVQAHSGAKRIHVFDHTLRTADEGIIAKTGARGPVKAVHNDYTEESAPQRVRDLLPDEADELLKRRFTIIQVWRAIQPVIYAEPLAICDGRTIPYEGFIKLERRYPYRTAATFHISYNPNHRWTYFPEMTDKEAIVFKVFDSDKDVEVRFSAHAAFDDPTSPPNAPLRESIELRALAFY